MYPTISVITPTLNGVNDLQNCLENVIAQNCTNVEHVVMDAGSKDGTVELLHAYAQRYSHIRWRSEPDLGQADALNKGTALARGSIISSLNDDDLYEPGVLNRVEQIFTSLTEPALVVGYCKVWDSNGKLSYINRPEELGLLPFLMGKPFPGNPSAYFYHRSLHYLVGGYDVNDHYTLDVDFLFKVVQKAQCHYFPEHWGNFFDTPGTKTHEDRKSGNAKLRMREIYMRYSRDLDIHQRIWVNMYRPTNALAKSFYYRLLALAGIL